MRPLPSLPRLSVLVLLFVNVALASGGVLEINRACAVQTCCFVVDAASENGTNLCGNLCTGSGTTSSTCP